MRIPKNTLLSETADVQTKFEAAENALDYVIDAMNALRGIADFEDDFNSLEAFAHDLKRERDELEAQAAQEYREEQREMERGYWLDVI